MGVIGRLCCGLAAAGMLWAAACPAAPAATLQGRVTHVTDGDSLWVRLAGPGAPLEVRLVDIDAPEICQPWGVQARAALKALVDGRAVTLRTVGRDRHGRTLARLRADGVDVNAQLVLDGHAWSARSRWDGGPLVKQERVARALRRGLHGQPRAQLPKDFRRMHGSCAAS